MARIVPASDKDHSLNQVTTGTVFGYLNYHSAPMRSCQFNTEPQEGTS